MSGRSDLKTERVERKLLDRSRGELGGLQADVRGHRREATEEGGRKAREKPHSPDCFLQDVGRIVRAFIN